MMMFVRRRWRRRHPQRRIIIFSTAPLLLVLLGFHVAVLLMGENSTMSSSVTGVSAAEAASSVSIDPEGGLSTTMNEEEDDREGSVMSIISVQFQALREEYVSYRASMDEKYRKLQEEKASLADGKNCQSRIDLMDAEYQSLVQEFTTYRKITEEKMNSLSREFQEYRTAMDKAVAIILKTQQLSTSSLNTTTADDDVAIVATAKEEESNNVRSISRDKVLDSNAKAKPELHFPQDKMVAEFRPPIQTRTQANTLHKVLKDAPINSAHAENVVRGMLSNKNSTQFYKGTKLENMTSEELLKVFEWEFKHLPIIHNGPFINADNDGVDDRLSAALQSGFLKNICQRWVYRGGRSPNCFFCNKMQDQFHLPPFKRMSPVPDPTLVESNDCIVYMANNLGKTECGNINYGTVTYVLNTKQFGWMLSLAPRDTGSGWSKDFGSLQDFHLLVQENVEHLNYNIGELMKRWVVPGTPQVKLGFSYKYNYYSYMEAQLYGNFHLPESLAYIIAIYGKDVKPLIPKPRTKMWGTGLGNEMRKWMAHHNRPLIWANCDDTGMLIDPFVGVVQTQYIQQKDIDYFNRNWNENTKPTQNGNWTEFRSGASKYLWFRYLNYFERHKCADAEKDDDDNIIIGLDGYGNCVYFNSEMNNDNLLEYECLNDGSCSKVNPRFAPGKTYKTMEDCMKGCGSSNWTCVQNQIQGEVFYKYRDIIYKTSYCIPDPSGDHTSRESCEDKCNEHKRRKVRT